MGEGTDETGRSNDFSEVGRERGKEEHEGVLWLANTAKLYFI